MGAVEAGVEGGVERQVVELVELVVEGGVELVVERQVVGELAGGRGLLRAA